jgi:hypothetical protein
MGAGKQDRCQRTHTSPCHTPNTSLPEAQRLAGVLHNKSAAEIKHRPPAPSQQYAGEASSVGAACAAVLLRHSAVGNRCGSSSAVSFQLRHTAWRRPSNLPGAPGLTSSGKQHTQTHTCTSSNPCTLNQGTKLGAGNKSTERKTPTLTLSHTKASTLQGSARTLAACTHARGETAEERLLKRGC